MANEQISLDPVTPLYGPAIYHALDAVNGANDLSGNARHSTGNMTIGGAEGPPGFAASTEFDGVNDWIYNTTYTTRRNLVPNPSMETGITGWAVAAPVWTGTVHSQSSAWSASGSYSMRWVGTKDATATQRDFQIYNPTGTGGMPVTAGATYTGSCRVNVVDAPGNGVYFGINWYTSGGAAIGGVNLGSQSMASGVFSMSHSMVAPPTAAFATVSMYGVSTVSGDNIDIYMDNWLFEQTVVGGSVGTYFDGSGYVDANGNWIAGTGTTGWLSTAHGSASDKGCFANGTTRTYSGWIYFNGTGGAVLVGNDTGAGPSLVAISSVYDGNTSITFNNYSSVANVAAIGSDVTWLYKWVHLAFVINEPTNAIDVYANGTLRGSTTYSTQYTAYPMTAGYTAAVSFGAYAGGTFGNLRGKLAGVAIHERGLTQQELATMYAQGSLASNRRDELNINSGAIQVRQEGVNWGTAEVQAAMAQQVRGESVVDYRIPNRQIEVPLVMQNVGSVTFEQARRDLHKKVAEIQQGGGTLKRVLSDGTSTYYADIVSAQVTIPGGWLQAHRDVELEAALTLQALPDFYGAEQALPDHTETTNPEITFTESTASGGDFPLGDRVRVVIDEDDAESQRGLFWSFRARHYNPATTAASAYEAEALTVLDTATRAAKGGASNGSVVTHGTLLTTWTPVVGTNLSGGSYLTHTGTNRVYARVLSTAGSVVQTRFVYGVGDMLNPAENPATRLYTAGTFQIVDYGEVRLDPVSVGAHRWQGQIQATGTAGTEAFSVDRIWIVNQDESAGLLSLPAGALSSEPSSFTGRDAFNQTAGTLHTKTADVGGAWDTLETGFSSTDFSVTGSTAFNVSRNAQSESLGRVALLGSAVTACGAQVDLKWSTAVTVNDGFFGIVARYTDQNNFVYAGIQATAPQSATTVRVTKRMNPGPTETLLGIWGTSAYFGVPGVWYRLRLTIDAAGNFALRIWAYSGSTDFGTVAYGSDTDLATGGALASGRIGFTDRHLGVTPSITRNYDNFITWTPTDNAILFASQSMELATTGVTREGSGGTAFVPVPGPYGDLPRMPNRSSAGTAEFMAKASRGDLYTLADPGIDDISARIYRSPSYLTPD